VLKLRPAAVHTLADFRAQARCKLPRFVFDYVDGGAGDERALARNTAAFTEMSLTPRIGADPGLVNLKTSLCGTEFAAPFGVAPLGMCGLVDPAADVRLARAAAKFGLPYIMSTTASTSLEEVSMAAGRAPWFQLYATKSENATLQLLQKIERLGCPALVVTVDTAAPGKRLRDLRNGLRLPYRPTPAAVADLALHPSWLLRRLRAGQVAFPNLPQPDGDYRNRSFQDWMGWQTGGKLDWENLRKIRAAWPRKLLLKGVLCAADAVQAASIGVDGVIVSNHGGRQLDSAPAPLSVLAQFVSRGLGPDFLAIDSGIRSGEDVIKCLAQGAGFTFLGRPFLFALAAQGEAGVERMIEMMFDDIARAMKLLGIASPRQAATLLL